MTRIYLVRHGETDYNKKGCYYGWTDCSLTNVGMEQSKALRTAFENINYDVILSSDLKRAIETANIINSRETRLITDPRLRELNFGHWEGMNHHEIQEKYEEHWAHWLVDWANAEPSGGESAVSMYSRIKQVMDEIHKEYQGQSIVIVSHNGALRMIIAYLLGLTLDKIWCFHFEHGKYSLIEMHEGHCSIKCINSMG